MFQHILIPTDGSELSTRAIEGGIALARSLNAKVTGFYAAPEYNPSVQEDSFANFSMSAEDYLKATKIRADAFLAPIAAHAKELKVPFHGIWNINNHPAHAIARAAEENGCDLIYMASHGRKGLQALLLGSETQKVLAHSKIPVLVHR